MLVVKLRQCQWEFWHSCNLEKVFLISLSPSSPVVELGYSCGHCHFSATLASGWRIDSWGRSCLRGPWQNWMGKVPSSSCLSAVSPSTRTHLQHSDILSGRPRQSLDPYLFLRPKNRQRGTSKEISSVVVPYCCTYGKG